MTVCIQCGGEPKYKCPTCCQPYCSVPCCKQHKETPCSPPPVKEPSAPLETHRHTTYDYPTEDTVAPETLKLLEKSAGVKKCLENPHVRKILEELDKSPHPDELIQEYMQEPIFTELVDECLSVVEPPDNKDK
ncbi:zinc finger HIT domain-containing protein 3 [Amyelois transitella]|uniref:zinc finger HIT domain-containing protein 3 n=1 Tax=Amyelois transitella TaxID=680683 RepID=UPI00298F8468|nr:zinc finger HIT domain-containing protein 3 [Amyelois transitella]